MTQTETQLLNETLIEQLSTPGMEKQAISAVNDYTRNKMREDGVCRRVLPEITINNSDLDRQVDTDLPVKVVDKEPDSPAAASLPFQSLPINTYIRGPRYRVMFSRIATPRFVKDVEELRTYVMDIRQILSDNSLKDVMAEEDASLFDCANALMLGPDTPVPYNGNNKNWQSIEGGITRETVEDARKIMPMGPTHLEAQICVVNNVTIKEVEKWGRDEVGGDFSQDMLKNSWTEVEFMRMRWIITIKRDLVPDDMMFFFASPEYLGKHYMLENTTLWLKREAFMVEFFSYQCSGGAIANAGGVCRADFI